MKVTDKRFHFSQSPSPIRECGDGSWTNWSGFFIVFEGIVGVDAAQLVSNKSKSYIFLSIAIDGFVYKRYIHGKRSITSRGIAVLAGKFAREIYKEAP